MGESRISVTLVRAPSSSRMLSETTPAMNSSTSLVPAAEHTLHSVEDRQTGLDIGRLIGESPIRIGSEAVL